MKKNDIIAMMHTLSNYSYDQLCTLADSENIARDGTSKVELITIIIAHRAANPVKYNDNKPTKDNRKKYCLHYGENDYYLELTKEQANFADWCIDRSIDFDFANIDEMNDMEWEAP